jgi:hypothetical protein
MGIHRSALKRRRRSDAAETRARNSLVKVKERARRDARMLEKVRGGTLPFTPTVMSWLSRRLGKNSSRITPDDIKILVA